MGVKNSRHLDFSGMSLICNGIRVNADKAGEHGTELTGTEIVYLDGLTPGTVTASKAVVVDSSSAIAGFTNIELDGPAGTGTATAGLLELNTAETTVVALDQLGRIDFAAPLEASGTDAILVAGSIWAEAEGTFTASVNTTALVFATGSSEAAAEKVRISSGGKLSVLGPNAHIAVRREIIADGANVILTEGQSGGYVNMDLTTGSLTTLPEITSLNIGMTFDFCWSASWASGSQKIICTTGDFMLGSIIKFDTDTLTDPLAVEAYNGSTHLAVLIDAATDGGLIGSHLTFTAISATQWSIEGVLRHTGGVTASASTT